VGPGTHLDDVQKRKSLISHSENRTGLQPVGTPTELSTNQKRSLFTDFRSSVLDTTSRVEYFAAACTKRIMASPAFACGKVLLIGFSLCASHGGCWENPK
jgi:hypothetical protein